MNTPRINRNGTGSKGKARILIWICALLVSSIIFVPDGHSQSFTFASEGQGFTATTGGTGGPSALFRHEDGRWVVDGVEAGTDKFSSAILTSPSLPVPDGGIVYVTIRHRFNFEADWDSGQLVVSVNGEPDQIAGDALGQFLQEGHTKTLPTQGTNPHQGQPVWTGQTEDIINSTLRIDELPLDASISLKFVAHFDAATVADPPSWEIFEVHVGEAPLTRTWIVDNDPTNHNADFNSLQAAIDAAGILDTLLVMPSGRSYGSVTVSKGLTIVGSGFGGAELLDQGQTLTSRTGNISIVAGTNGLSLVGLEILGTVKFLDSPRRQGLVTSNTLLYRNRIEDRPSSSVWPARSIIVGSDEHNARGAIQNLFVINNWIHHPVDFQASFESWRTDGAYFLNNIIRSHFLLYGSSSPSHAVVANNVFPSFWQSIWLDEGLFENNIVIRDTLDNNTDSGYINRQSATISNNIFVGAQPFTSNNAPLPMQDPNLTLKARSEVVVGEGEWWEPWVLIEGSPAANFGADGTDAGIFGGTHPWDREQKPPMPFIRSLRGPSVVTEGETLSIEIEIESNE